MAFDTNMGFVDYQVEQPIGTGEIRARLKSKINREKLIAYNIMQGPFKDVAELGPLTKKVWLRFGKAPPKAYFPNFN